MTISEKHLPTELFQSYLEGKCGFFVGAGLSRGAGYPQWDGLLYGLIEKALQDHSISEEKYEDCKRLASDPSKYLMLAEELRELLGVEFKTYIEETFSDGAHEPTRAHELLVQLERNNFIITTNYDQLIENAFVKGGKFQTPYKYYEAHAIQRQLFQRKFFLLKAHGDATTAAEKLVLTDKDYRRLLYQEPGYQSALQSVFTMYSVVFLGCSLNDPELKLLLNYINAAFPEGGIPHYALMDTETLGETERNRWRKDYNIRIIPISSTNNYQDIETFLEMLLDKEKDA